MKVLCTINNIFEMDKIEKIDRVKKYIHLSDGQLNLKKGAEYCVYGIAFRDNSPWYYLCLNDVDYSPTLYPSELFKITDDRLSSCWKLSIGVSSNDVVSQIVFGEWANDNSFYERLVESDPSAIELFKYYQNLINKETFARTINPSIKSWYLR